MIGGYVPDLELSRVVKRSILITIMKATLNGFG